METYTRLKKLTENPSYPEQRKRCLANLSNDMIDEPIIDLVRYFNQLPYCFTMQSCYGHFLYDGNSDPHNIDSLPHTNAIKTVEYRIAYVAFCVENSVSGRRFLEYLGRVTLIDPENIQFCCAEWFWSQQVNSFALQVEPDRFKHEDKAVLDYAEALKVEIIRNKFFYQLNGCLKGSMIGVSLDNWNVIHRK